MEKAPFGEIRVFLRLHTLIIALMSCLSFSELESTNQDLFLTILSSLYHIILHILGLQCMKDS